MDPDLTPLVDLYAWAASDRELDRRLRDDLGPDGVFARSRRADAGPWPKVLEDATVYAAELRFEPELPTPMGPRPVLLVREAIVFTNRTGAPLDRLVVRVFANATDGRFGFAGRAWVDGEPMTFGLEDAVLTLPLVRPLRPGDRTRVLLEGIEAVPGFDPTDPTVTSGWWAPSAGVLGQGDDQVNLGLVLPTVAANEGGVWDERSVEPNELPAVYDPAHWHVTVTAPARYTVASTGVELGRVADAAWATTVAVAGGTRDFAAALVPDARVEVVEVGGTRVRVVWRGEAPMAGDDAEDREIGGTLSATAAEVIRELGGRFGPLASRELDVVEAPIRGLVALDFPELVLLDARHQRGAFHRSARHEWALAHALAHQWWGHDAGNDGLFEPWLDEGLAEHGAALYWERVYGRDGLDDRLELEVVEPLARMAAGEEDFPPGDLAAGTYDRRYGVLVDGRAGLLFDDLRRRFGDDRWLAALAAVREAASGRRIHGRAVLELLQAFAPEGVDVEAIWDADLNDPAFADRLLLRAR